MRLVLLGAVRAGSAVGEGSIKPRKKEEEESLQCLHNSASWVKRLYFYFMLIFNTRSSYKADWVAPSSGQALACRNHLPSMDPGCLKHARRGLVSLPRNNQTTAYLLRPTALAYLTITPFLAGPSSRMQSMPFRALHGCGHMAEKLKPLLEEG